jgi:hypothetical protein
LRHSGAVRNPPRNDIARALLPRDMMWRHD